MNLTRGINLTKIAEKMNGCSGAELKGVCTEAGMFALRERRVHVTQEDFDLATAKILNKHDDKVRYFPLEPGRAILTGFVGNCTWQALEVDGCHGIWQGAGRWIWCTTTCNTTLSFLHTTLPLRVGCPPYTTGVGSLVALLPKVMQKWDEMRPREK